MEILLHITNKCAHKNINKNSVILIVIIINIWFSLSNSHHIVHDFSEWALRSHQALSKDYCLNAEET